MKLFLLFGLIFPLYAQNFPGKESIKFSEVVPNTANTSKEKSKLIPAEVEGDELDKEFYTYYYMNLPKHLKAEEKDKKKFYNSIIPVVQNEILKRDRSVTIDMVKDISQSNIKTKRVYENSQWMKQIKNELKYLRYTEYMYIIKYKQYLVLVLFHLNPEVHIQSPSQVEFLKIRELESIQE